MPLFLTRADSNPTGSINMVLAFLPYFILLGAAISSASSSLVPCGTETDLVLTKYSSQVNCKHVSEKECGGSLQGFVDGIPGMKPLVCAASCASHVTIGKTNKCKPCSTSDHRKPVWVSPMLIGSNITSAVLRPQSGLCISCRDAAEIPELGLEGAVYQYKGQCLRSCPHSAPLIRMAHLSCQSCPTHLPYYLPLGVINVPKEYWNHCYRGAHDPDDPDTCPIQAPLSVKVHYPDHGVEARCVPCPFPSRFYHQNGVCYESSFDPANPSLSSTCPPEAPFANETGLIGRCTPCLPDPTTGAPTIFSLVQRACVASCTAATGARAVTGSEAVSGFPSSYCEDPRSPAVPSAIPRRLVAKRTLPPRNTMADDETYEDEEPATLSGAGPASARSLGAGMGAPRQSFTLEEVAAQRALAALAARPITYHDVGTQKNYTSGWNGKADGCPPPHPLADAKSSSCVPCEGFYFPEANTCHPDGPFVLGEAGSCPAQAPKALPGKAKVSPALCVPCPESAPYYGFDSKQCLRSCDQQVKWDLYEPVRIRLAVPGSNTQSVLACTKCPESAPYYVEALNTCASRSATPDRAVSVESKIHSRAESAYQAAIAECPIEFPLAVPADQHHRLPPRCVACPRGLSYDPYSANATKCVVQCNDVHLHGGLYPTNKDMSSASITIDKDHSSYWCMSCSEATKDSRPFWDNVAKKCVRACAHASGKEYDVGDSAPWCQSCADGQVFSLIENHCVPVSPEACTLGFLDIWGKIHSQFYYVPGQHGGSPSCGRSCPPHAPYADHSSLPTCLSKCPAERPVHATYKNQTECLEHCPPYAPVRQGHVCRTCSDMAKEKRTKKTLYIRPSNHVEGVCVDRCPPGYVQFPLESGDALCQTCEQMDHTRPLYNPVLQVCHAPCEVDTAIPKKYYDEVGTCHVCPPHKPWLATWTETKSKTVVPRFGCFAKESQCPSDVGCTHEGPVIAGYREPLFQDFSTAWNFPLMLVAVILAASVALYLFLKLGHRTINAGRFRGALDMMDRESKKRFSPLPLARAPSAPHPLSRTPSRLSGEMGGDRTSPQPASQQHSPVGQTSDLRKRVAAWGRSLDDIPGPLGGSGGSGTLLGSGGSGQFPLPPPGRLSYNGIPQGPTASSLRPSPPPINGVHPALLGPVPMAFRLSSPAPRVFGTPPTGDPKARASEGGSMSVPRAPIALPLPGGAPPGAATGPSPLKGKIQAGPSFNDGML